MHILHILEDMKGHLIHVSTMHTDINALLFAMIML